MTLPWGKTYSLPFWANLYRSVKTANKEAVAHLKKTELAAAMLKDLAKHLPHRHFLVFADNAYVNSAIVRELPDNVHLVGRGRMDAALYDPPNKPRGRGRPPIRGKRPPTPAEQASRGRWRKLNVTIYGKQATVRVKVFDALWYKVGSGRIMRFVIVRDWPGHEKDDVLVSTDLTLVPAEIIGGLLLPLVAGGDVWLGEEPSGPGAPAQPYAARGGANGAHGAMGILHRGVLVRAVVQESREAAYAIGTVVREQDDAELCRHAREVTPGLLDSLDFGSGRTWAPRSEILGSAT